MNSDKLLKVLVIIVWVICVIATLCGCDSTPIIYTKNHNTERECICNYYYKGVGSNIWFQDSCHKYKIGDTLK